MKITIRVLQVVLVYSLLCLVMETFNFLIRFEPAHKIANQAITDHNDDQFSRCMKVMDDVVTVNPFNLPASIKLAATDVMKKEGCK